MIQFPEEVLCTDYLGINTFVFHLYLAKELGILQRLGSEESEMLSQVMDGVAYICYNVFQGESHLGNHQPKLYFRNHIIIYGVFQGSKE